jgi:23S rRNA (cytosine1962-C5)-methyltransferase
MSWQDVQFWVEPTPFKHLGVFPEQSIHWDWMRNSIRKVERSEKLRVLNLFGYTGISSVVCAKSGAFVTHVDGSKPAISWARENMLLSGLPEDSIRWILDDVMSFVKREVRRGTKYDAIIMDPPVFGHGAKGEIWKFQEHFPELIGSAVQLLSDQPLFVIVNAYAVSASSLMLQNVLEDNLEGLQGTVDCGELVLEQPSGRELSTGIFGRWSA